MIRKQLKNVLIYSILLTASVSSQAAISAPGLQQIELTHFMRCISYFSNWEQAVRAWWGVQATLNDFSWVANWNSLFRSEKEMTRFFSELIDVVQCLPRNRAKQIWFLHCKKKFLSGFELFSFI